MNRRRFVLSLATLPVIGKLLTAPVKTYGCVDIPRHVVLRHQGIWLKAFFNGEDVTTRCTEANDEAGYVVMFKHRDGKPYLENGEIAKERRYGKVHFRAQSTTLCED